MEKFPFWEPEPGSNLVRTLNLEPEVWFGVRALREPNLMFGFRFRPKMAEPEPNRTVDSLMGAIKKVGGIPRGWITFDSE